MGACSSGSGLRSHSDAPAYGEKTRKLLYVLYFICVLPWDSPHDLNVSHFFHVTLQLLNLFGDHQINKTANKNERMVCVLPLRGFLRCNNSVMPRAAARRFTQLHGLGSSTTGGTRLSTKLPLVSVKTHRCHLLVDCQTATVSSLLVKFCMLN